MYLHFDAFFIVLVVNVVLMIVDSFLSENTLSYICTALPNTNYIGSKRMKDSKYRYLLGLIIIVPRHIVITPVPNTSYYTAKHVLLH